MEESIEEATTMNVKLETHTISVWPAFVGSFRISSNSWNGSNPEWLGDANPLWTRDAHCFSRLSLNGSQGCRGCRRAVQRYLQSDGTQGHLSRRSGLPGRGGSWKTGYLMFISEFYSQTRKHEGDLKILISARSCWWIAPLSWLARGTSQFDVPNNEYVRSIWLS